jgi:hypothetical protein
MPKLRQENNNMGIEDVAGLGKAAETLIDRISAGIGKRYKPRAIRNEGGALAEALLDTECAKVDAKVYEIVKVAEAESKANLIRLQGDIEAAKLRERAGARFLNTAIRKQANVEAIIDKSVALLESAKEEEPATIEDDWIMRFLEYAENVSNEQLRQVWARILADKAVATRRSMSLLTLDSLRLMEPHQAESFEAFCKIQATFGAVLPFDGRNLKPPIPITNDLLFALEELGFTTSTGMNSIVILNRFYLLLEGIDHGSLGPTTLPKYYDLGYRGRELADVCVPEYADYLDAVMRDNKIRPSNDVSCRFLTGEQQADILSSWANFLTMGGADVKLCMPLYKGEEQDKSYRPTHLWKDGWEPIAEYDENWLRLRYN